MDFGGTASDWLNRIVHARSGQVMLFIYSILEASFLPVPVEAVMAPYMEMRRDLIWRLATLALAGFMLSALLGYAVGAPFFDQIAAPLIAWMGWEDAFEALRGRLVGGGFLVMLAIALTPMPTQVAMIGAGAFEIPLPVFVSAVLAARALRYYGLGLLVWRYGDRVVAWIRRRTGSD